MLFRSGSSPKVVRWGLFMQGLDYVYNHIAGLDNFFPDRLSRQEFDSSGARVPDLEDFTAPDDLAGGSEQVGSKQAKLNRAVTRSSSSKVEAATGQPSVVVVSRVDESERRRLISSVHNNLDGHHGIHRTVGMLQAAGHQWPKMGRDVAEWIASCVVCQKNRPKGSEPSEARGTLRQYTLFAEVSIDFIGPLPKDQVDNSYVCGITCGFSGFVEAFAVEAATAVVAAHCLVSVFARYSAPQQVRSDRGTHFVNEIIEELLRVFKVMGIVTHTPLSSAGQWDRGASWRRGD